MSTIQSLSQPLPMLDADVFLTDGGIETTLIFEDGFDLPDFAAFTLLGEPAGRAALEQYFDRYARIAVDHGVGIVLETPTWRASADWGARAGLDVEAVTAVNQDAVALVAGTRAAHQRPGVPIVISGCIGPRGDGYAPSELMTSNEARTYHSLQARAFAEAGADLITAITMTYAAEAIGIAAAAQAVGLPVVLSFTVETDGRLPDGSALGDAIAAVDDATGGYPAYYMVNCAHPTHFAEVLDPAAAWTSRLGGIRANASTASHAELDEAEELDAGDPADLAERYAQLRATVPSITVLGGCCGTNHEHIGAIAAACITERSPS
jgi:S-methylmethionine-dependent homocysteine/selenocysteine methylase